MTLLRPRWVAGHLLVLVLSASFIALGFWQLARNDHKQQLVRDARAAFAAPAPDVSESVPPGSRVEASGHYDPAHEVLLRNQVHDGKDGDDVLTPLVLADGSAVIVDRGWVAATGDRQAPINTVAATGAVVVRGIAHTSSPLRAAGRGQQYRWTRSRCLASTSAASLARSPTGSNRAGSRLRRRRLGPRRVRPHCRNRRPPTR